MNRDREALDKLLEDLAEQTNDEMEELYRDYYKNDDGIY